MKKEIQKNNNEISKFSEHISGDLTVDGQLHVDGDITANGKIRSTNEGGIGAINPEDNDTSAYLGFSNNTARIRLRGDGLGADGPFQIQGRGDSVRLSVEEDGTVIDGTLDVDKKVTAPEFIGDLIGNAMTATTLETPRTINNVPFDGSESITITAQPSTHTHPISQVTNLQTELNNRSLTTHSHTAAQIGAAPATHAHTWNQITDRPSTFPPATHAHNWESITERPTTFTPSTHNHTWNQIIDRPTTLPPSSHAHNASDITAGTLPIARGGTGATTAAVARTNLGAFPTSGGTMTGALTVNGVIRSGNVRTNNSNSIENLTSNLVLIGSSSGGSNTTAVSLRDHNAPENNRSFSIGRNASNQPRVWTPLIYNRTTSSAANMRINSDHTLLRVTSAAKYKLNITKVDTKPLAEKILDLDVTKWFDKSGVETYADMLTKKSKGEACDFEDIPPLKEHYGLIAEDVVAAGLDMYVDRDHNGEIEGIEYERLWTLLIPLVRDQRNTITKLNEEIHLLKQRIEKLETKEGE